MLSSNQFNILTQQYVSGNTSSGKLAYLDTSDFLYLSSKYQKHPSKPATHIASNISAAHFITAVHEVKTMLFRVSEAYTRSM